MNAMWDMMRFNKKDKEVMDDMLLEHEVTIWSTYLAGTFWVLGWPYQLAFGCMAYGWLAMQAMHSLWYVYDLENDLIHHAIMMKEWMHGPFRRFAMGVMIFMLSTTINLIPGLHMLSPLFGWWAVADFYDYGYDIEKLGSTVM